MVKIYTRFPDQIGWKTIHFGAAHNYIAYKEVPPRDSTDDPAGFHRIRSSAVCVQLALHRRARGRGGEGESKGRGECPVRKGRAYLQWHRDKREVLLNDGNNNVFGAAGVQKITCTYGSTENRKYPYGLGTTMNPTTVLESLEKEITGSFNLTPFNEITTETWRSSQWKVIGLSDFLLHSTSIWFIPYICIICIQLHSRDDIIWSFLHDRVDFNSNPVWVVLKFGRN